MKRGKLINIFCLVVIIPLVCASISSAKRPPKPAAPTGLTVAMIYPQDAFLSWNSNSEADIAGYYIFRNTSKKGTGQYLQLNSAPVSVTSYVDSSVTIGMTYYYKVSAVNTDGGEGKMSAHVSIKVVEMTGATCNNCHGSLPQYDYFYTDGHGKAGVNITCADCHDETHTSGSYKYLKVINGYPYPDSAQDPYNAVLPRKDFCASACHNPYQHLRYHPLGYDYLWLYDIWTYIEILTPQDYITKYGEYPGTKLPRSVLPLLDVDNDSSNSYGDIMMCSTCHSQHGTAGTNKMIRMDTQSLCRECHTK